MRDVEEIAKKIQVEMSTFIFIHPFDEKIFFTIFGKY